MLRVLMRCVTPVAVNRLLFTHYYSKYKADLKSAECWRTLQLFTVNTLPSQCLCSIQRGKRQGKWAGCLMCLQYVGFAFLWAMIANRFRAVFGRGASLLPLRLVGLFHRNVCYAAQLAPHTVYFTPEDRRTLSNPKCHKSPTCQMHTPPSLD